MHVCTSITQLSVSHLLGSTPSEIHIHTYIYHFVKKGKFPVNPQAILHYSYLPQEAGSACTARHQCQGIHTNEVVLTH